MKIKRINVRAGIFLFDNSMKYVLLHKKIINNSWMLPGGRIEPKEKKEEAIKREIIEELGWNVNPEFLFKIKHYFEDKMTETTEINYDFKSVMDFTINDERMFTGLEGKYMIFKWINLENIDDYKMYIEEEKEYLKKLK